MAPNVGSEQLQLTSAPDIIGTIAIDGAAVRVPASGITVLGQDARLTFNATAGQRIALQVTSVTNPSVTVNLLKPDGTTQASLGISNAPGQVWFMDTQTLATTGTYTLWVKHLGTNTGSETLQLSSVPADISLPITIGGASVRAPASGNTAVGQNASLTFTATAGQKMSLSISTTFASGTCTLSIKTPNGGSLVIVTCQTPYVDTLTLSLTGTYSVFIDPQGTATGNITVQLNDDTPLTGTIAIDGAALRVPASGNTSIGQDAQYTFSATAGQRVALQATSVTNPLATVVLLKPDGTTQTSVTINNSPAGQTFFMDTQTLVTAGTYSLLVRHVWTNAGSETLQLISVPADDAGTLTINGAAVRIPATGSTALGQNANRTFSATAGQSLKINLSNTTFPQNTCLLTLTNPSGSTVTSGSCGINGNTIISATAATAGTYTISIDPQGTSTGSVNISVTSP